MPVQLSHALYLENLPAHHKDPFDRCCFAGIVENMTLVSAVANFLRSGEFVGVHNNYQFVRENFCRIVASKCNASCYQESMDIV